ncbi:hypothetical protein I6F35_02935 [Bradyrhizobium sp. BRP22]|uniref:hypothetical protein n=1 Tax=Bradyrhizobium sp. BRP22 TaxID=2793821 RepID=UPI001CD20817|nr:hypothetical protein [Bradyrhizobium sp. BRP22]MCA1452170.1 hypothetical protein [Bradyrhizobium sp. BRP22]
MSNSFERYAAMAAPRRSKPVRVVRSEANAPLVPTVLEKEQRDNSVQFARYKRAVRTESTALLSSEHSANYRILLALLRRLTPQSSHELVDYVKGARWIKACDRDQQFTVLSMMDMAIVRARVHAGLPPFDDALPGEPDNAFLILRKEITGA